MFVMLNNNRQMGLAVALVCALTQTPHKFFFFFFYMYFYLQVIQREEETIDHGEADFKAAIMQNIATCSFCLYFFSLTKSLSMHTSTQLSNVFICLLHEYIYMCVFVCVNVNKWLVFGFCLIEHSSLDIVYKYNYRLCPQCLNT